MTNRKTMMSMFGMMMVILASWATAAEQTDLALPTPRMTGGKPLLQALKERQTIRVFSPKPLPLQLTSDLLWAAFGINRPDSGKRTAPSTLNWQEVDVYAILADGAYRYDAKANSLQAVANGDLRPLAGTQKFVLTAPLNLVYVVDSAKMKGIAPADQALFSGADVGFISQNVYLFCASEGLATVVRGSVNHAALTKALNLSAAQKVILAQTVGYPGTEPR